MALWLLPGVYWGCDALTGDTAESWVRSVINTRFRVASGQARAVNLAEIVGSATPGNLLCRVYRQ